MNWEARLNDLRSKPEHVRRRVAFWSSFGITALIFMFWLASFSAAGTAAKGKLADVTSRVATPAESLIAGVGSFFVDIKDMIFAPKKVTYPTVQALPGDR